MSTSLPQRTLRGGWWFAVICAAVGVAAASLAATVTPPVWTASTTLTIQGPDVQDTSSGFLVTEMAARSAAALVMRSGFVDGLAGVGSGHPASEVNASVPFGTSNVVITVAADDRDQAIATANGISLRLVDRVKSISSRIAISPTEQRVARVLPVRLRVLSAPSAPTAPASPQVGFNMLAGATAGFALGAAVAVFRELVTPSPGGRPRRRRTTSRGARRAGARRDMPDTGRPPGNNLPRSQPAVLLATIDKGRRAC